MNRPWFFSATFAMATVTIVSGCLAERTRLVAYPVFTMVLSLVVVPILTHWVSWGCEFGRGQAVAATVTAHCGQMAE